MIKGLFLGALLETAARGSYSILKESFKALAKGFFQETGKSIAIDEDTIDKIASLLPTTEKDEQIIDDALMLINDDVVEMAWYQKLESFEDPLDPVKSARVKEYYRRFTVKRTAEKTAAKIRRDAAKHPDVWAEYVRKLDIERKVLDSQYQTFIDWVNANGEEFMKKVKADNKKVEKSIFNIASALRKYRLRKEDERKDYEY
jgi:hypothetical protein